MKGEGWKGRREGNRKWIEEEGGGVRKGVEEARGWGKESSEFPDSGKEGKGEGGIRSMKGKYKSIEKKRLREMRKWVRRGEKLGKEERG